MNVLFYVEPLTERENPTWKLGWIQSVELMMAALRKRWPQAHFCCVVGDGLEDHAKSSLRDCTVAAIHHTELIPKFGPSALSVAMDWYRGGTEQRLSEMGATLKDKLAGFSPDITITFSAAPFVNRAFPGIPVLHYELGIVSRPPFPPTAYLDPLGMFNNSYLIRHRKQIQEYSLTDEDRRLVDSIRKIYLPDIARENPLSVAITEKLRGFQSRVLVALQFSQFYGYDAHATYPDQYDLLVQTLENVSSTTAVIATEHPIFPILTPDTVEYLQRRYANFIWLPEFRTVSFASQYLMEFVDGVVTVSSSVGLQTLLWKKPLVVVGHSHLDLIADAHSLSELQIILKQPWPLYKESVLAWHLTRYSIPASILFDEGMICDRIRDAMACLAAGDTEYENFFAEPYTAVSRIAEAYEQASLPGRLRRQLAERDSQVAALQEALAYKDRVVNQLVSEKEQLVSDKEQVVSESRRYVAERDRFSQQLDQIRQTLETIQDGTGWKVLQSFWRLRDSLLPGNTQRRKLYDQIMKKRKV